MTQARAAHDDAYEPWNDLQCVLDTVLERQRLALLGFEHTVAKIGQFFIRECAEAL